MASDDFERLSESMMDEVLRWDPSYATQLGWHKYDHMMMDPRPQAFAHQARRLRKFIETLDGLECDGLSDHQLIDRDLARYLFKVRLYEIEKLRVHEQMSIAEEEVGRAMFFLFVRDHPPFDVRVEAITARLEKTPEFLERAKSALVRPCRLWNEMALETGDGLPSFLYMIRRMAASELEDDSATMRLGGAVERALEAISAYEGWLRDEILPGAREDCSISEKELEEYMAVKEFGLGPEEALEISRISLEAVDRQRRRIATELVDTGSLADALRLMKSDHPKDLEGVLGAYREWIARARDFVVENDLATVPDGEKLMVIETPHFMRHLVPFAAQYEPGKYTSDMTGLFLVTLDEGNPDLLKEHCYAAVANTSVHEAYPGHHLQGIQANTNPSHIRTLSTAMCFAEGWALYCESMMFSEGFQNTALGKLAQLNDLVFRIVRVEGDIQLAKKAMEPQQVADLLVRETGMEPRAALDEARSYTLAMTNYLSYFIGMLKVMQLREDVEASLGDRFDLKEFHDSLLRAGCLPVHFMRRVEAVRLERDHGAVLRDSGETLLEFTKRRLASPEPF